MPDANSHSAPAKKEAKGSTAPSSRTQPVAQTLEESIGFIGLGHMGSAMAAHLATGGRAVIGYLRQPERNAELKALGMQPPNKLTDLFDCDIVITMLPNDAAAHEIVFGGRSPQRAGRASCR